MLDFDLAELYQVSTKALKQAVKKNLQRFPNDFMFELNIEEWEILRSQFVTSRWGGRRYMPFAFTELASKKELEEKPRKRVGYVRVRNKRKFL